MCQNYSCYWVENKKQNKQSDCLYGGYILMRNPGNKQIDNMSASAKKQKQIKEFKVMGKEWNKLTLKSIWLADARLFFDI